MHSSRTIALRSSLQIGQRGPRETVGTSGRDHWRPDMTKPLDGKAALVTGGGRSIGRETALGLAGKGADVIITYKENAEAARATVQHLESRGVRAAAFQVNLTGTQEIDRLVGHVRDQLSAWGRSD